MPTITNATGSFTGTWGSPAAITWLGTFTATGNYPSSGFSGTSVWDFSGLSAGNLPSGTYVRLGDVDNTNVEVITLRAFDASNVQLTNAWLINPFVPGATPSEFLQSNLPSWNLSGGVYTFTGVDPNTLLTVSLQTNTVIRFLQVYKAHVNNGFALAAPTYDVPKPGTWLLVAAGFTGLAPRPRRR